MLKVDFAREIRNTLGHGVSENEWKIRKMINNVPEDGGHRKLL
jgi:hypothetical protein